MSTNLQRTLLFVACAASGVLTGCLGMAPLPSKPAALRPQGNVVVSCSNATSKPATWRIAVLKAEGVPTVFETLALQPQGTGSVTVEAPIARIGIGAIEPGGVGAIVDAGAVNETKVVYGKASLEGGRDFSEGDVITLNLAETTGGQYKITAEVSQGG